jgi:hypothetical protein
MPKYRLIYHQGINGRIILKCIQAKRLRGVFGLMWLRIRTGTDGEVLSTRNRTYWFYKRQGISWLSGFQLLKMDFYAWGWCNTSSHVPKIKRQYLSARSSALRSTSTVNFVLNRSHLEIITTWLLYGSSSLRNNGRPALTFVLCVVVFAAWFSSGVLWGN